MSEFKRSTTGLMDKDHEVRRLENLFFKAKGSAYYFNRFGIDWDLFLSERVEISIASFLNYFTQEATKQGIVITDVSAKVENFTLILKATLLSEKIIYLKRGV